MSRFPDSTQIDSSPNQTLYMLCASPEDRSLGSDAHQTRIRRPRRVSIGSDALNERGARRNSAPVAQRTELLTSDCPDVCSMRHEGNGHAKRAGSDALSERGLACPSRFSKMRPGLYASAPTLSPVMPSADRPCRAGSIPSLLARGAGGIRGLVDFALRRGRQEPGPEHVVAPPLVAAGHEPTAPDRGREFASRGLGSSAR